MSDSVRPHRRLPTRLLCPWDSPGKNTGVGCHFLLQCMKVKCESEVLQSYPTLSDPMDCSLPGFSIHEIFQARIIEWWVVGYGPIRVFFRVSCRWQSEGFFGQSLLFCPSRHLECSLAWVILCCLVCQAHREAPWLGFYSVDWIVSHLKGHPRWGPTL